jgi:hypothetical protein
VLGRGWFPAELGLDLESVRKMPFRGAILYQKPNVFTKTGSGQAQENVGREKHVFLNAGILPSARPRSTASTLPRTPRMCSLDFSRSGSSVHCAATPDR